MIFTENELKVMQTTLVNEWEVKQGIRWTVDEVDINKLVNKIDWMLPMDRRFYAKREQQ